MLFLLINTLHDQLLEISAIRDRAARVSPKFRVFASRLCKSFRGAEERLLPDWQVGAVKAPLARGAAAVFLAESPEAVGGPACRRDVASFYVDHDLGGACVCFAVDAVATRALRLDAGVIHGDVDIAGASATAQG